MTFVNQKYHHPVLAFESIEGLNITPGADIVDATYGGGGHSQLILEVLGDGRLIAFDQDLDAAGNITNDDRLFFIRHNFRYLKNFLFHFQIEKVDGILADLGVSSHDFDVPERGFSYRLDGNLDMRMNQKNKTTAAKIVDSYSEQQLVSVFRMYGEIKNARKLANTIIQHRKIKKIETTGDLANIAKLCSPKVSENKYLAQVFQALRIEVNDELGALKDFLEASCEVLKPGGRLVIITYHSLEDRLCKHFMRAGNFEGKVAKDFYGNTESPFRLINKKVITPSDQELMENTRSRSAKLRIAEKI